MTCIGTINGTAAPRALPKFIGEKVFEKVTDITDTIDIVDVFRPSREVLDIAKGKYVVRLDADDWFHELALFAMVSKIEENPKAGIIYGNYFYKNEDGYKYTYMQKDIRFGTTYKLGRKNWNTWHNDLGWQWVKTVEQAKAVCNTDPR